MDLVVLVILIFAFAAVGWGVVRKSWLIAGVSAGVLITGVVWIVLLMKAVEATYRYAGHRQTLKEIAGELRTYHEKHGSFPPGMKVADLGNPLLPGPDAGWGYVMTVTDQSFSLTSWARDGKPGGERFDQDIIVSWKAGDRTLTTLSAPISP